MGGPINDQVAKNAKLHCIDYSELQLCCTRIPILCLIKSRLPLDGINIHLLTYREV
jgi:hypothetical protein